MPTQNQQQPQQPSQNNLFLVWRVGKLRNETFRKNRDRGLLLKRYVH